MKYCKTFLVLFIGLMLFSCSDDDDYGQVATPEPDLPNLVEAAQAANLNVLLDAVNAVDGLGASLLEQQSITVFAPTNQAFDVLLSDLGFESLDALVEEIGVSNLNTVLGFHVVPSVAFAADLAEGEQQVPTLSGQNLSLTKNGNSVFVSDTAGNTYSVTTADVAIENGVVHIIDGVLLPELSTQNEVRMTVSNSGASAYFVTEIIGNENVTALNENNSTWTLSIGTRYILNITGASAHPLALRDAGGNFLLSQNATQGSFGEDENVNFQVNGSEMSFTLTEDLANEIDNYVCVIHGGMTGSIIIN